MQLDSLDFTIDEKPMRLFLSITKISIILLTQQATPAISGEHTLVVRVREDQLFEDVSFWKLFKRDVLSSAMKILAYPQKN